MLPKKYRLPVQDFIKKNRFKVKVVRSDYFIIKPAPNNLPFSRFGAVVSGKVNKSAVRRNKIKRIIFDFIRLREYYLEEGKDVLVIVLPLASKLTKAEIEKELENMLNK